MFVVSGIQGPRVIKESYVKLVNYSDSHAVHELISPKYVHASTLQDEWQNIVGSQEFVKLFIMYWDGQVFEHYVDPYWR